jgi:hypothetical protein
MQFIRRLVCLLALILLGVIPGSALQLFGDKWFVIYSR